MFGLKFEKFSRSFLYIFSSVFLISVSNLDFNFAFYVLVILSVFLTIIPLIIKELRLVSIAKLLFGFFYISLPLSSFLVLMNSENFIQKGSFYASWLIFSIFATVWICDSLAYFGGKILGKRKLAPNISPNKTVEGSLSGFIGSALFAIPISIYLFNDHRIGIILSIAGGFFGQIGDLVESKIKRETGVKDSSNLIPGHGGLLDRIDSLLFATPITLILLEVIK